MSDLERNIETGTQFGPNLKPNSEVDSKADSGPTSAEAKKATLPEGYSIDEMGVDVVKLMSPSGEVLGMYVPAATQIIQDAIKHSRSQK
jgi:hypothetical protein